MKSIIYTDEAHFTVQVGYDRRPAAPCGKGDASKQDILPEIAFGADTTLGYLTKRQAYRHKLPVTERTQPSISRSWATTSVELGHGDGTLVVVDASQEGSQSLLTNPRHA
jgi:hypothetical protein